MNNNLELAGWLMPSGLFRADQPIGFNDHDRAVCAAAVPLYRLTSSLPVDMPLADSDLKTGDNLSKSVWLNRATAVACAEKRYIELVKALSRFQSGSGSQVEGISDKRTDAIEGLDKGISVGLGNSHGGAPVKDQSVGAP